MRITRFPRNLVLPLALAALSASSQTHVPPAAVSQANAPSASPQALQSLGKLPLSFEPNVGQTGKQAQWLARGPQYTLFLAGDDAVLQVNSISPAAGRGKGPTAFSSAVLRMDLLGARPSVGEVGEDPQAGKSNYFTGNDPAQWRRGVPNYGRVRLQGVYPGIDLVYYGRQGQLEYDFVVAPGADPSAIRWGFEGGKATLAEDGGSCCRSTARISRFA